MLQYVNPDFFERTRWGKLAVDLMENDVIADDARAVAMMRLAARLVTEQGRRVLVVTPRAAEVDRLGALVYPLLEPAAAALKRTVTLFVPDKPPVVRAQRGETAAETAARKLAVRYAWEDSGPHGTRTVFDVPLVGKVTEGMDRLERQRNYEAPVVFATYDIMKEGVSFNAWDTLLDLDNTVDPEQVVGRIQRAGDKKVPLVIDVWSPVSLWKGMMYKRAAFYRGERFAMRSLELQHDAPPDTLANDACWSRFNRKATAVL
jgi:hypothetical protein